MKRLTIYLALFHDALYQVLDNRVFRILMVLSTFLVAIPWLIGFREDEVVLAFGWRTYFYQDLIGSVGWMLGNLPGTDQERLIGGLQRKIVSELAGTFGLFFCLAATSFFVPRLLEKGAADPLFSKPVSRFSLLFSRYIAGLIFIAGLSTYLVGGIHLGLLVNSHFSDSTFLWAIPILTYKFALLFSFTVLVGVWTRSATASLLLSFVLFGFAGGVHTGWKAVRMAKESELLEQVRDFSELNIEADAGLAEVKEDVDSFTRFASMTLSVLHHGLPKTSDADALATLVRKKLEVQPFEVEFAFQTKFGNALGGLRRDGIVELQVGGTPEFIEPDSEGLYLDSLFGEELEIEFSGNSKPAVLLDGKPAEMLSPNKVREAPIGNPNAWYASRFHWDSPWRYNAWYSLASSLAFAAAMLGLAWLRLRRVNF